MYEGKLDARGAIASELLTNLLTYLTVCKRFEKYSTGSLSNEVEYVCNISEVKEALMQKGAENLKWSYPGAFECMKGNDFSGLERIVVDYVEMLSNRSVITKIIGVLKSALRR